MIAKINKQGHSFKGVTAYLMHDKNALSSDRVEWSSTGNMFTSDIDKASLVMAWTDENADMLKRNAGISAAGRKVERGAVYHYSLSWAPGENPDREHQMSHAVSSLEKLGLSNNQYYIVAHNDTDHPHVHVVVNLTDQETGKRIDPHLDKRALQEWALDYEKEYGIHCKQREINADLRSNNETQKNQNHKQDYSEKVTKAYIHSDSGKAFINALEAEGLHLGKARRGKSFVIVDENGSIQKLSRQLDIEQKGKAKTVAVAAKLSDIDIDQIQDGDELSKGIIEGVKSRDSKEPDVTANEQSDKLLEDINLISQEISINVIAKIESELGDGLAELDKQDILESVKDGIDGLIRNDIKPTEKMVDTIINNAADNKRGGAVVGGMPIESSIPADNVLERLMGDIDNERLGKEDDLFDRLMGTTENKEVASVVTTQRVNNAFEQSNPFRQSNPFIGKNSDLFGQSEGIGSMVDEFQKELEDDTSLDEEQKSDIFNKVISDIKELSDNNIEITSDKFNDIKNIHIKQSRGIGR